MQTCTLHSTPCHKWSIGDHWGSLLQPDAYISNDQRMQLQSSHSISSNNNTVVIVIYLFNTIYNFCLDQCNINANEKYLLQEIITEKYCDQWLVSIKFSYICNASTLYVN